MKLLHHSYSTNGVRPSAPLFFEAAFLISQNRFRLEAIGEF